MVRSKIFEECVFLETRKINSRDDDEELSLYEIQLLNCNVVYITVGKSSKKKRHMCLPKSQRDMEATMNPENTLIYYPIYLMDGIDYESAIARIGIYEVVEKNHDSFVDEDGDLVIEKLDPLIFNFVSTTFLEINNYQCSRPIPVPTIEAINDSVVAEEDANGKALDDVVIITDEPTATETLIDIYPKQTVEHYYEELDRRYLSRPLESDGEAMQWTRSFFMNKYFKIKEKGGEGDCLFYSLASAINDYSKTNRGNGVPVFSHQSVTSLRERIADSLEESDYENYLAIYKQLKQNIKTTTIEIKRLLQEHSQIAELFKSTTLKEDRLRMVEENSEIKRNIILLENQLVSSNELIKEFRHMKSITSLRDFKAFVMTDRYWGDEMALGILQKYFNFKAIVLSQEQFVREVENTSLPLNETKIKNMKNIIQCGSSSLGGIETPYFYIILNFTGNHYQLITYRNRESFVFEELPLGVKIAIVRGCMRQDLSAGYGAIKSFVDFRDENIEFMF